MSTNELSLTLVGWVATEPKLYTGAAATPFTSFRMASTRRYFDRTTNAWVDGRTEWFTVKAWRQQAYNVAASLRKSDPVIVHGRVSTEEWTGTEGLRTSLVLEAISIGPDLTFGQAKFARTVHVAASGRVEQPEGAGDLPADAGNAMVHEADTVEESDLVDDDLIDDDFADDLAGVP